MSLKVYAASTRLPSCAGERDEADQKSHSDFPLNAQGLYYTWSKEFLEAGKKRLSGDTERQATSGEVTGLKREMRDLKEVVADLTLENRILKKSVIGGEPFSAIGPRTMASDAEE